MTTVRLLSYNVRSLRDDEAAVARVIRSASADVVCIQEAPRFLRWRSRCAGLARRSGMVVVGGGRPAGANLMLSSLAVAVRATHDVRFTKDPRRHQRGTVIAELELTGSAFAVAGTHLDLDEAARLRHVQELHRAVDERVAAEIPVVVAGDVNDRPDGPVWAALTARGDDAHARAGLGAGFTFSAADPVRRIDGVFVDPRIRIVDVQTFDSADVRVASDHRPVLVELELP